MSLSELLFSLEGRIGRATWWKFNLALFGLSFLVGLIDGVIGTAPALSFIWMLVAMYPSLAVHTKRWHDRGKSGWWNLILLLPVVSYIWGFIELGCLRGTTGKNTYGPDPVKPISYSEKALTHNP